MATAHAAVIAARHSDAAERLAALRADLPEALRGRLCSAGELVRRRAVAPAGERLPTGMAALDHLLAGGLPRGALVELVGRASCGRFAAVLGALAAATGGGETAALVDLGDHLDPQVAAAAGIQLERLLWLRPRRLTDALVAAGMLVDTGFPLVVLDAGLPPLRGRAGRAPWLRLARAAVGHHAAVLVAAPYRLSGAAAVAVVEAGRGRALWRGGALSPRLLDGVETRLLVAKRRGAAPGAADTVTFLAPEAAATTPAPRQQQTTGRSLPSPAHRRPAVAAGDR